MQGQGGNVALAFCAGRPAAWRSLPGVRRSRVFPLPSFPVLPVAARRS